MLKKQKIINQKKKYNMRKLTKSEFIANIMNLQMIIDFIKKENFYDMIVRFLSITSKLYDHLDEIKEFPLKGKVFLGIKSKERKIAEKAMIEFVETIKEVYESGDIHPRKNYALTKDDIYLDAGIAYLPVSIIEIEDEYSQYVDIKGHLNRLKAINTDISWIA